MERPYGSYAEVLLKQRYRPGGVIGRGGMSTVYRARDEFLGRDVALKLFGAIPAGTDSAPVFSAELRMLAGLNHHGIVTLLDAGIDDSLPDEPHPYLIMELVTGTDLEKAIAAGGFSARGIAEIGYDLAEALEYVHSRGVVHRDLKPSNVLLVDYGANTLRTRARLTDFGIAFDAAAALGPEETNTTGTAAYLSPEQVLRDLVGPASDVYALGLVLLECFTRHVEYPGDPSASAVSRLKTDPSVPDTLTSAWRSLLTAMLRRDPAARPPMRDVLLALRQIIVDDSGRHRSRPEPIRIDEPTRMAAVRRYEPYVEAGHPAFERVANIARRIADVPVASIGIAHEDEVRFLAHPGTDIDRLPRDETLCSGVIADDEPWVVENCALDPRSSENTLVTGEFGMRFYVGVPVRSPEGFVVGVLSVIDFTPRTMSDEQLASLVDLASVLTDELELQVAIHPAEADPETLPEPSAGAEPIADSATPVLRFPQAV
ncbi:protein kinase [Homoserinibacter sp. GY 40078]|uniref:protein kinase domain-containing protein n=1 Tax=Homoserinibacter sp. GY 40078 TaxID=2603275 RepID=UPI0011C99B5B|nr:protein kinase [Homoserinibacter sp. GY 40078]TXK19774.1 protein kinase [Homoserinibacter sp. GY 40078]